MRVGLCKCYCYMWFALCDTNFMVTCHLENLHLLPYKKELIAMKKKNVIIKNKKLTHVTSKILMKIVTTKITSIKLYYFTSTNLTLWIE